jgi:apolipoprotein N-acyltransferase
MISQIVKRTISRANKNIFLFLLSFVICAFSQPAWNKLFSYLAYFFGFSLLFLALYEIKSNKKRFLSFFIWFCLVQMFWLSWFTSTKYQGPLILIIYFLLIFLFSLEFALISFLLPKVKKISYLNILTISSILTIFEFSKLFILCGFSFNQIGAIMSHNHLAMQLASIVGVYGLSFFVIALNLILFKAVIERNKKVFILYIFLALFPYVFGFFHIKFHEKKFNNSKTINAILVQTSILPEEKNRLVNFQGKFVSPIDQWRRILIYINQYKDKKIDYIVLPEAAVPFLANDCFYPINYIKNMFVNMYGEKVLHQLNEIDDFYIEEYEKKFYVSNNYIAKAISLIFNSKVIIGLEAFEDNKSYNSAFYFHPNKNKFFRYDKNILVPMGEYIPFSFLRKIAKEKYNIVGSFDKGEDIKVFFDEDVFSISICYEETFNDFMRKSRNRGANLFINITNDAWFYNSKLFLQHFYHSKIRTVENGVALLRSSNNAVTCSIDSFGRVVNLIDKENVKDAIFTKVSTYNYFTLFSIWGNYLIISLSFFIIFLKCFTLFFKKIRLALKEVVS